MRLINKIFIALMLLVGLATAKAQQPVATLFNLLTKLESMEANFEQLAYSANKQLLDKTTGNMILQKPAQFIWHTKTPDQSIVVSDGVKIWHHDILLEQVTVQSAFEAANSPVRSLLLLSSVADLELNYTVEAIEKDRFLLKPKTSKDSTANDMGLASLELKFQDDKLNSMVLIDVMAQKTEFYFTGVKYNKQYNLEIFKFHAPSGVDVIGEIE